MSTLSYYEPSSSVEWMHDRDRFGNPNTLSSNSDQNTDYATGVATNAAVLAGIGVFFWLVTFVFYCLVCCGCCCKNQTKRAQNEINNGDSEMAVRERLASRQRKRTCCVRIGFFVLLVALGVCSFVSISQVTAMGNGLSDSVDVLVDLKAVTDSLQSITTNLKRTADAGAAAADQLALDLTTAAQPAAAADAREVATNLRSSSSTASDVSDTLGDLNGNLDDASDTGNDAVDTGRLAGFIYSIAVAAWAVLTLLTLCGLMCCKHIFRICMLIGLLLLLIVWLVAGGLLAWGMVSSDVCFDPLATTLSLLDSGSSTRETAEFYFTCDPAGGSPPQGVLADAQAANQTAVEASQKLDEVQQEIENAAVPPPQKQQLLASVAELQNSTAAIRSSLNDVLEELGCNNLNSLVRRVIKGYCSDSVDAIIVLWAFQVLSAVLLLLLVYVAAPFWNNHPSSKLQALPANANNQQQDLRGPQSTV